MQSDPITTSGIDRHGDPTVTEVDVQQIAVDAQKSPVGVDPSLKSTGMDAANKC